MYANTNIYGPEGVFVASGDKIPDDWDPAYVEDLLRTGGARKTKKVANGTGK